MGKIKNGTRLNRMDQLCLRVGLAVLRYLQRSSRLRTRFAPRTGTVEHGVVEQGQSAVDCVLVETS